MRETVRNEVLAIGDNLLFVHMVYNEHGLLWNDTQHELIRWQCIHEYRKCSARATCCLYYKNRVLRTKIENRFFFFCRLIFEMKTNNLREKQRKV